MKKQLLIAIAAGLFTTSVYAQSMVKETGRTTVGIRGGVNFQNINGKDASGNELKNSLRTGLNGGLNLEIPLGAGAYLQPGVLYSTKGAESGNGHKVKLSYVEVPVNVVYKPLLGTGNMLLGFGPYVGYGVNGKVTSPTGAESDIVFNKKYDEASTATQIKPIDAGGNLLVGYEFANKLSMQLNAQLGLMNINPETSNTNDQTRWRNTGFGVSLGYRF